MKNNVERDRYGHSDEEIERDVAELKKLLNTVEGPQEPHPAYWQNFVVKVHDRIEQERPKRRRSWVPSIAWSGAVAAAIVVAASVGGLLPGAEDPLPGMEKLASEATSTNDAKLLYEQSANSLAQLDGGESSVIFTQNGERSIILSDADIKMLNAIQSDDEDAIFLAMLESESF